MLLLISSCTGPGPILVQVQGPQKVASPDLDQTMDSLPLTIVSPPPPVTSSLPPVLLPPPLPEAAPPLSLTPLSP